MFRDLILKNRSYRRFNESARISTEELENLAEFARLSPSSRNQQALKFALVNDINKCEELYEYLAWAGYLPDWKGPMKGERPAAYIVILGDKELGSQFSADMGIAAQSILLGAVEAGLGGCMIGSIQREKMRAHFNISETLEILLVLALGEPVEKVVIDEVKNGDIKYWRDQYTVHHVPKRNACDTTMYL